MKELGKINHRLFEDSVFKKRGANRPEIRTGPGFGVDVAVIDIAEELALVTASDPLSLIPTLGLEESAWLSVYLMANDMATTGHLPMYGQFVLNLPSHLSEADFRTYWDFIHKFCKDLGIAITGGHTGFIEGQNSTIAGGGTLTSVVPKQQVLISKNAKAGNALLVTKQCAISSSAILAMSFPETVRNKLGQETYLAGCDLFYKTSSVQDGVIAAGWKQSQHGVTAMHDVTEGGVLGAIYEVAVASGNGVRVYDKLLPMGNIQTRVCDLFDIDPRFSIGAGSMIIAVEKGSEDQIISHLRQEAIDCTVVGELTDLEHGLKLIEDDVEHELPYSGKDPYWQAFFNALKKGWK